MAVAVEMHKKKKNCRRLLAVRSHFITRMSLLELANRVSSIRLRLLLICASWWLSVLLPRTNPAGNVQLLIHSLQQQKKQTKTMSNLLCLTFTQKLLIVLRKLMEMLWQQKKMQLWRILMLCRLIYHMTQHHNSWQQLSWLIFPVLTGGEGGIGRRGSLGHSTSS